MDRVRDMIELGGGCIDYHARPMDEDVVNSFASMLIEIWAKLDRIEKRWVLEGNQPAKEPCWFCQPKECNDNRKG